jgi:hypothetical protein
VLRRRETENENGFFFHSHAPCIGKELGTDAPFLSTLIPKSEFFCSIRKLFPMIVDSIYILANFGPIQIRGASHHSFIAMP